MGIPVKWRIFFFFITYLYQERRQGRKQANGHQLRSASAGDADGSRVCDVAGRAGGAGKAIFIFGISEPCSRSHTSPKETSTRAENVKSHGPHVGRRMCHLMKCHARSSKEGKPNCLAGQGSLQPGSLSQTLLATEP